MSYAQTDTTTRFFPPVDEGLLAEYHRLSNIAGSLLDQGADSAKISDVLRQMDDVLTKAENIWLASVGDTEEALLSKTREIVSSVSREEVVEYLTEKHDHLKRRLDDRTKIARDAKKAGDTKKAKMLQEMNRKDKLLLNTMYSVSFEGAWAYLASKTFWIGRALDRYGFSRGGYEAILDERATEYNLSQANPKAAALERYNRKIEEANQLALPGFFDEPYRKILQGAPQLLIMPASTRKMKLDKITGEGTLSIEGKGKIVVKDMSGISAALTASTRKLLDTSAAILAERLPYRPSEDEVIDPVVMINLSAWGKACGLDLLPKHCDTTEEMETDKKRIDNIMHDFKATARKDCKTLKASSITFKDGSAFYTMGIVSGFGIKDNTLRIAFDIDFAKYLANAYIMQWPTALLKHDNRDPNAYSIGWKLAYHYSLDSNRILGTNTRISVAKLLEAAPQIMSYADMIASGNKGWRRIIKAPLEKALDAQIAVGYLTRWEYYQKDEELKKEQAGSLSYEEYAALIVEFSPAKCIPDTERLVAKAEEKEKAEKKKRGRPRKNKSE